jgi:hypothetical protein
MSKTKIEYKGPLFDGRGKLILERFERDAEQEIAQDVNRRVHSMFARFFKHQTGRYASTVQERRRGDGITVGDSGLVYGPWLEGVSSKNATTRFKGYHSFKKTFELEEHKAVRTAEVLFARKYKEKF